EHGRIYRIKPKKDNARTLSNPDLRNKSSTELVGLLAHPNHWWRNQAQRLLFERQDASVIPVVKSLFKENEDSRARLHALYVLEGIDALDAPIVREAIADAHPEVRVHGIILAERYPENLPQIIEAITDEAPRVAFQATLSLGQFDGPQVLTALARIAAKWGGNPWFRTAELSSEIGSSMELLRSVESRVGIEWRCG